jgi:hypothetical protein
MKTIEPVKKAIIIAKAIPALVRAALEILDPVVIRCDLELILTIAEKALQPRDPD